MFGDANQDQALAQFTALKWRHGARVCVTANRIYVQDEIYEEFLESLAKHASEISLDHGAHAENLDRSWRMLESLEAGIIGLNTGNSSAAETPFGSMKMSGYGKGSGEDVAVAEYLVAKSCTMTVDDDS
ncbi:Succinate-semialdehyde dehydrogenase, mitochondrial [Aspergillus hancockii]|nr:Succinate-semialdehyde dehydrogenase, mitochondrial [Aspergillus hancockii]